MIELTLWLPDAEPLGAAPALRRWLVRADPLSPIGAGREATVRAGFQFLGTEVPYAALSRSLDANDAAGALWLRADPACVVADAVTARLLACGALGLSDAESTEFARSVRTLFGDAGFLLEPTTPQRWYLRCPREARLPHFAAPDEALGDDLAQHLPRGDNERQWRHLLNEAQVILHNHPHNVRRQARGLLPVNSLWFWGAGCLPEWVRTPFDRVLSNDRTVVALARLAGVTTSPVSLEALTRGEASSILLDLRSVDDRALLERDWFPRIERLLAERTLDALTLSLADGRRVRYRRVHRWRVWRRPREKA